MASQNPKFSKSFLFISWKASIPSVWADRFHERITGVAIGSEASTKLSPNKVSQIASLGFNPLQCQKEAINISNFKLEEVMNWLLSHMDDLAITILPPAISQSLIPIQLTIPLSSPLRCRLILSTTIVTIDNINVMPPEKLNHEPKRIAKRRGLNRSLALLLMKPPTVLVTEGLSSLQFRRRFYRFANDRLSNVRVYASWILIKIKDGMLFPFID
ncbi:hypothetical protein E3N88_26370 [Mikania micrantha]|uniref:UBA domain-containing protein n=1 Tax=Mikania micrantha TaxID=192012 RepID=A0A5N6NA22_9ASTR|nr:hypothetical protein E3N88_26370 [Mikania micrantha]